MFLMDLSVHESDLNETYSTTTTTLIDKDSVFPTQTDLSSSAKCILDTTTSSSSSSDTYNYLNSTSNKQDHQQQIGSLSSSKRIAYHRSTQRNYLGNSLDRLASAIDGSPADDVLDFDQYARNINDNFDNDEIGAAFSIGGKVSQVTVVEPQPLPELENQLSSASSLSDESFVASGGSSTSYTASCESVGDDRESTTTREDSGVLDIKDLDNQLSNSFDNEHEEEIYQLHHQEKPISNNVTATNLTHKSVKNNNNNENKNNASTKHHQSRPNKNIIPTNNNNNNHHHHHSSTNHSQPLRSMSASLPIEVPPRQMKKELKKSKNDYKNQANNNNRNQAANASASAFNEVRNNDEFLDDDFLEQEYNENHHNHYPIDEFDEEHLRAQDNPMKLFESIQALARSLHEDTEIFGSLPPKRLLESPIRSLAFA